MITQTPPAGLHEATKATLGEYPDGRMGPNDLGATPMEIGVEEGRVVMKFARPITWLGLTGAHAMELAVMLMKHARRVGATESVVWRLNRKDRP